MMLARKLLDDPRLCKAANDSTAALEMLARRALGMMNPNKPAPELDTLADEATINRLVDDLTRFWFACNDKRAS